MLITIQDKTVHRGKKQCRVDQFCEVVAQNTITGLRDDPIPDNVRWLVECGNRAIYIIELQPELRSLVWNTGPAQYEFDGHHKTLIQSGQIYTLATPYVVIAIPFLGNKIQGKHDRPVRVFYRNSPLRSIDNKVCCCNLNNVLAVAYGEDFCGALCLDGLITNSKMSREDVANAVVNQLWGGEFNHEYDVNFNAVSVVDKRISSVQAWEEESIRDPGFVLDVKWPETNLTIRELIKHEIRQATPNIGNLILKAR